MSVYEASITNPKKQLEFYKDLSEQLQQKNNNLQQRIDKAIEYMNNTFNISSVKDMFDIMNKLEEILGGKDE